MAEAEWQPKIIAFVCKWCTYAGADLAGTSRMKCDASVRALRVPCTGRIDPLFILKAFERGADSVIVSGCHPGDCHYTSGNYHARRRWIVFRDLLRFMGIDERRVHFSWVSAAEGRKWTELVNDVARQTRELGPFDEFRPLTSPGGAAVSTEVTV